LNTVESTSMPEAWQPFSLVSAKQSHKNEVLITDYQPPYSIRGFMIIYFISMSTALCRKYQKKVDGSLLNIVESAPVLEGYQAANFTCECKGGSHTKLGSNNKL